MARPLPKDLEMQIAGTAKNAEAKSWGFMGFALGTAFGFGLGAAFFTAIGGIGFFAVGAGVIGAVWYMASRAGKKNSKKDK